MDGTTLTGSQLTSICDSVINVADTYSHFQAPLDRAANIDRPVVINDVHALFSTLERFENEIKKRRGKIPNVDEEKKGEVVRTLWTCHTVAQKLNRLFEEKPGTLTSADYDEYTEKLRSLKVDIDNFTVELEAPPRKSKPPLRTAVSFAREKWDEPQPDRGHDDTCICDECEPRSPTARSFRSETASTCSPSSKGHRSKSKQHSAHVPRTALGLSRDHGSGRHHVSRPNTGSRRGSSAREVARRSSVTQERYRRRQPSDPGRIDDKKSIEALEKIEKLEAQVTELATENNNLRTTKLIAERSQSDLEATVKDLLNANEAKLSHLRTLHSAIWKLKTRLRQPSISVSNLDHRPSVPKDAFHDDSSRSSSHASRAAVFGSPPDRSPSYSRQNSEFGVDGEDKKQVEKQMQADWPTLSEDLAIMVETIELLRDRYVFFESLTNEPIPRSPRIRRERERDPERERARDPERDRQRDYEKERERDRDYERDRNRDRDYDRDPDKFYRKDRERDRDEARRTYREHRREYSRTDHDYNYDYPAPTSSRDRISTVPSSSFHGTAHPDDPSYIYESHPRHPSLNLNTITPIYYSHSQGHAQYSHDTPRSASAPYMFSSSPGLNVPLPGVGSPPPPPIIGPSSSMPLAVPRSPSATNIGASIPVGQGRSRANSRARYGVSGTGVSISGPGQGYGYDEGYGGGYSKSPGREVTW